MTKTIIENHHAQRQLHLRCRSFIERKHF